MSGGAVTRVHVCPGSARREGLSQRLLTDARENGRTEHSGWRVRKEGSKVSADVVITALYDDGVLHGFGKVLGEVAQYIFDTYGRFPATFSTMVLTGYVQAVHLDTDYYDTHFDPGAYLPTQADHWRRWHPC